MPTATVLFVDGPCRLRKRSLTFDVQPPEFLQCGGVEYIYSVHQGIQYLNYVVQGGPNDTGQVDTRPQRDMFNAWTRVIQTVNGQHRRQMLRVRAAGRRARRAVR